MKKRGMIIEEILSRYSNQVKNLLRDLLLKIDAQKTGTFKTLPVFVARELVELVFHECESPLSDGGITAVECNEDRAMGKIIERLSEFGVHFE